jgi:hypothetical protein
LWICAGIYSHDDITGLELTTNIAWLSAFAPHLLNDSNNLGKSPDVVYVLWRVVYRLTVVAAFCLNLTHTRGIEIYRRERSAAGVEHRGITSLTQPNRRLCIIQL